MKKILLLTTTIVLGLSNFFVACNKNDNLQESTLLNHNKVKSKPGAEISVKFSAGHSSSSCSGSGVCGTYIWYGPIPIKTHYPCTGPGKDCDWTITISMATLADIPNNKPFSILGNLGGYSDDLFLMPDRSIFSEELNQFVNIPKQQVLKEENFYRFNNVSLTEQALFDNND